MKLARFLGKPQQRTPITFEAIRSAAPIQPNATPGQRWRFRRNLCIYVAHRAGLSQRVIADVFDLPRSRISEIIRTFAEYEQS